MRHGPGALGAVAMEAAAEVVVDAALAILSSVSVTSFVEVFVLLRGPRSRAARSPTGGIGNFVPRNCAP